MRRSVREATIGFSLLAALVGGLGLWFWLTGVVFGQKTYSIRLRFQDAAGLAPQSVVTYQGVPVGSVHSVTPEAGWVAVEAKINDRSLKLFRPITAQIRSGSLLGGDPQVALDTQATIPASDTSGGPTSSTCNPTRIVCEGGLIKGEVTPSLTTVMGLMERILTQADQDKLISKGATTLTALTKTSEDFSALAEKAEGLVAELQSAVANAGPVIDNLDSATAHASNVLGALDNPKSLNELKKTVSNAEQLTRRIDVISGDIQQLTSDPNVINGFRSVSIGLGKFFDELYPSIKPETTDD
jgi:phospholipid/cholesterol/gamma-HCH transport system substrate-binding protein